MAEPMHLLATYPTRNAGRAAQVRLEGAGIPSILVDNSNAPYSHTDHGMRLLVTPALSSKAQVALGLPRPRKALGALVSVAALVAIALIAALKTH